jgi:CRISPR-associated protein Cmr5
MTRAQRDLVMAERLITEVTGKDREVQKIYGRLCHSFPVLVRTCGLCQALAFSEDKATPSNGEETPRNKAHRLLLRHVAEILGVKSALKAVRSAEAAEYMLQTRIVLGAWIYFKRFAVSILNVDSAQDESGGN